MTYLIAFAIVFLLAVVVIQIGKITDLAARIRGEEAVERANNDFQGKSLTQIIQENKSTLEEHNFDFSLFPLLEETLDNPSKENLDQLVVYYSAVLDRAIKMSPKK